MNGERKDETIFISPLGGGRIPASYPMIETTKRETSVESSDRLLRENAVGWVEHFAMHGNEREAEGIYRFLCRVKSQMESERGFGKKS